MEKTLGQHEKPTLNCPSHLSQSWTSLQPGPTFFVHHTFSTWAYSYSSRRHIYQPTEGGRPPLTPTPITLTHDQTMCNHWSISLQFWTLLPWKWCSKQSGVFFFTEVLPDAIHFKIQFVPLLLKQVNRQTTMVLSFIDDVMLRLHSLCRTLQFVIWFKTLRASIVFVCFSERWRLLTLSSWDQHHLHRLFPRNHLAKKDHGRWV